MPFTPKELMDEIKVIAEREAKRLTPALESEKLTPEEYAAKMGMFCPYCGEENITYGQIQTGGDSAWLDCECDRCAKEWVDQFKLVGYSEVE